MRVAGRVVTPTGVIEPGVVEISGDTIAAVRPDRSVHSRQWVLPGFVDIHNHGGGGHGFGSAGSARAAAAFHLGYGTTTLLASLVSAPAAELLAATAALAPLVGEGSLAGIHFEGPYLARARCGAQNPAHLRDPDPDELTALLAAGAGTVRMVTLAPERPGALEAVKLLDAAAVAVAIGHTDADYTQTRAAVAAGARVATHLFNGMRPPHHRDPGPVFALLGAAGVVCELIADGAHLHDGTLAFTMTAAGADRVALVTDAMAAAGMPDGAYRLGDQRVEVRDRVPRLVPSGSIAGSTLTMDAALRRAVAAGASMVDAARMAATTPAAAIGLGERTGALLPGRRADLVVLDDRLRVVRVVRGGREVSR